LTRVRVLVPSAAVVTLAANPPAHQTQSRHSDVQGSSDVITAVPKFTAKRSHPYKILWSFSTYKLHNSNVMC